MAKIPAITIDKTLTDIDRALENKRKLESPRHYLGMSQIGEECRRKLFYSFRNAWPEEVPASNIRAIEDGFLQEDIMAKRLRLLPYIQLHTVDPENPQEQIGFSLLMGHFRGHCDGMILGVRAAPGTWHVWENKAVGQSKYNKLEKLKQELGEKNALKEWDIIYYDQAIIYMHVSTTTRHYLNVETPGGRDYTSCRTNYDPVQAQIIIEKAKGIIFDNWSIPAQLSYKKEFYKCKWCEFSPICHDKNFPLVHCKTCRYSEPVNDGKRKCVFKNEIIKDEELHLDSCRNHIYNPALISAELIEQQQDCCILRNEAGFVFANCPAKNLPDFKHDIGAIHTSQDLFHKIKNVNNFSKDAVMVQKSVDGKMEDPTSGKKAWEDGFVIDERLKGL
jgi:hypothetical protein